MDAKALAYFAAGIGAGLIEGVTFFALIVAMLLVLLK